MRAFAFSRLYDRLLVATGHATKEITTLESLVVGTASSTVAALLDCLLVVPMHEK